MVVQKKTDNTDGKLNETQNPEPQESGHSIEINRLKEEIDNLRIDLERTKEEVINQKDQNLRAAAEIENMRRRNAEDVSKARRFSIECFSGDLIPVKDSLEAALMQDDQTFNALQQGLDAILKQLSSVFDRNQIKEILPKHGDKFNPHIHQAISSVQSEQESNTIIQVLQKGYTICDRTLRPAMVIVAFHKDD